MLVEYAASRGVARITLNRPEKRNALNRELILALNDAFAKAAADAAVRVILLRGAGKDFCAGLDLAATAAASEDDVLAHLESARTLADLFLGMRRHPKPIIAAVHGRAIAGGCGLATAADLVLATASAEFSYPEVNIGFVAAIVMSLLRRSVGEKRAFEILARGEALTAQTALDYGIINRIFADDEFEPAVQEYAGQLAAKSASALTLTKDLFHHIDGMTFEAAVHAGLYGNTLARMTPDARHGFESFAKKRP